MNQPDQRLLSGKSRWTLFRILMFAVAGSIVLALVVVSALHWRRQSPNVASDPYANIPFRPAVTYDSWNVSIRNTEPEPYLNTSLILYVGGTRYSMQVGTIRPGEIVTRSLLSLTNEHGESFNPNSLQISELEVRANFRGHEVHKDFPPPT
jgi:hypothetical protein